MYHKELEVYKKSIEFVAQIYKLTADFPKEELYGLTSQLRRAAISIPSNIAEGCARTTYKQVNNFVNISLASLAEIETQLEIACVLGYVNDLSEITKSFNNIKALLLGLKKHLSNKITE